MYKRSEGFFKGYQDVNLFFQIWENPEARGTIIVTHGHGEHSEAYIRLVKGFENDKWNFYAWDMRGHGRSEGRRGYSAEFDDYCRDYRLFLDQVLSEEKVRKGPVILFCHSMGALVQFKTLIRNQDLKYDAIVCTSPLLGIAVPVPGYKAVAATVFNTLYPKLTMGNELRNDMLTRDLDVIRQFEQDALRHDRMSPGVFLGMVESFDFVKLRANEIKKPLLLMLAEHDEVVSTPVARAFYDKVGSTQKELFVYPGAKHELVNDTIRNTVFADMKKFLDGFLESK